MVYLYKHEKGDVRSVKKVFIIPYSHVDWAWRNKRKNIVRKNIQIIFAVLDYMRAEPGYKWCGTHDIHFLSDFWEQYPEFRDEFRQRVKEGRIDTTSTTVTTPAPHCVDGESYIRNITYGRKFFEEILSAEVLASFKDRVLYPADVNGHHSQIPQLAKKSGFKYYKIDRPPIALEAKKIPREFIWEGLDGSKILCCWEFYARQLLRDRRYPGSASGSPSQFKSSAQNLEEWIAEYSKLSETGLMWCTDGNDWSMPTIGLMEFVRWWNETHAMLKLVVATPTEYFRELEKEEKIPAVKGSLDPVGLDLSTIGWALTGRRGNMVQILLTKAANALLTAERLASIATFFGKSYPQKKLEDAWKVLTSSQAHCITYLLDEDFQILIDGLKHIIDVSTEVTRDSLNAVAEKIAAKGEGIPLVVFNPLPWIRYDIATARVSFEEPGVRGIRLEDRKGNIVPFQIVDAERRPDGSYKGVEIIFHARAPSLGYGTYYVKRVEETPQFESSLSFSDNVLENRFFQIRIGKGCITSIRDKRNGREIIDGSRHLGNEILCEKGDVRLKMMKFVETHRSSTFESLVKLLEDGPVRIRLSIEGPLLESDRKQEITLYDSIPKIDFKTRIECRVKEARHRVVFPVNMRNPTLHCDIPFGVEERHPELEPTTARDMEVGPGEIVRGEIEKGSTWGTSWAELSDGAYGVSLINMGTPGYLVKDNYISNILLTTAEPEKLEHFRIITSISALGKHEFAYCLYPHPGDWSEAKTYRTALEFLTPLQVMEVTKRDGDLPEELSFLQLQPDNVMLSAMYIDGDDLVLRFYEVKGASSTVEIRSYITLENLRETDFLGDNIKSLQNGKHIRVSISPFEIKTLRARL